VTYN